MATVVEEIRNTDIKDKKKPLSKTIYEDYKLIILFIFTTILIKLWERVIFKFKIVRNIIEHVNLYNLFTFTLVAIIIHYFIINYIDDKIHI